MQTAIADFSITKERDIAWAAQRTRLLGTLANLRQKSRNEFAKAVTECCNAVLGRPLRGTLQFSLGKMKQKQFLESAVFGKTSDEIQPDTVEVLQKLVDDVSVDTGDLKGVIIKLRMHLPEDVPQLTPHDIADWGRILATRTTEGALVQSQSWLRERKATSGKPGISPDDSRLHELLTLVASTTDNSVVVMNAAGEVDWVNDSFTRMTGYELSEVLGRPFVDLLTGPDSDPTVTKEIQSAIQSGHGLSHDLIRYRKDGKTFWELLSLSPVFDENGLARSWVSIGADISARHAAEDALAHAKAAAEASSSAKSEFLANMSHEIRTPLNAVLGMTDLVLATKLTSEQHEYLSIVKESSQALMGLLNDILDLSKIEAGKLEVDAVPFDLERLLNTTLEPFSNQAGQKNVELVITIQPGTPVHVIGDTIRVRQILVNLVSNALKFTSAGSIAINVESQWETDEELSLHISVSDTGIGMSKETLQRIFGAFAQADSTITRKYGGTGLGLTISARLVELMGGRIWVNSHEGKGSTFHISLPFQKIDEHEMTKSSRSEFDTLDSGDRQSRALQVLVADDNQANRMLARRVLEKRGHSVTIVTNGSEALDHYRSAEFDVAILDVQMPEIDGFSVAAEIRREESAGRPRLPLVAMTAHAMPGDRERCIHAGMDAYLAKPIHSRELYRLVESLAEAGLSATEQPPASDQQEQHPFAKALARLEGDEDLLREQMQFFLDESPDLMDQILTALDEEKLDLVRVAAHRLKGLAGTIDEGELFLVANRIEQSSASGSHDDVTAVVDELALSLTQLTDQVSGYLTP